VCGHRGIWGKPGQAVDIPVVGLGESTMHFACQLGRKFALAMPTGVPGGVALAEEAVRRQGLRDRLSTNGLRWMRHSLEEWSVKGSQNPQIVADDVAQTARECATGGADVVIVFCGRISPFCSMVGLNKVTVAGQDVPVLDPHMIAAKTAEMLPTPLFRCQTV
jgi:Asp/Glu/hydantoin racemase